MKAGGLAWWAAMHAPEYVHWHGMYEVGRKFYTGFLPGIQELADYAGQGGKYRRVIQNLLARPKHRCIKTGGSADAMKLIEEEQRLRYNQ